MISPAYRIDASMQIHKIGPPLSSTGNTVSQEYRVTRLDDNGGPLVDIITIIIDFDKLAELSLRAVRNTSGRATLYYGGVIAKIKE